MDDIKMQVIPIKIMVEAGCSMDITANHWIFDSQQQPLYKMTAPQDEEYPMGEAVELTEELFCRILSIDSVESVKGLISDYPEYRFAYRGSPFMVSLPEFATVDTYAQEIISLIEMFKSISTFYSAYLNYNQRRLLCDRETMQKIYKKYYNVLKKETASWWSYWDFCDWLESSDDYEECDDSFENDGNEEENEECSERIEVEGQECLFPDLPSKPGDEADGIVAGIDSEPPKIVYYILDDFNHFLYRLSKGNTLVLSSDDLSIICSCKTFLSAMFVMMTVSTFNKDEYRQCANAKCNTFYKVNKSHPQTLCPKHMAPRQRKRENTRKKGQVEDEEADKYIKELNLEV